MVTRWQPTPFLPRRVPRAVSRWRIQLHRQCDPPSLEVNFQHFYLQDIAGLYNLARVLDELVRHHGDVYETILVHADVNESSEVRHVGDHAFEQHAGCQVLEFLDALLERRRLE